MVQLEDGKGRQVVGVVAVGDAGNGVVVPAEGAALDGGLEAGKHLQVGRFAALDPRPAARLSVARAPGRASDVADVAVA